MKTRDLIILFIRANFCFTDKVLLITGASSGIGKACAFKFAEMGAKVVLAARRENELKNIENEIRQKRGGVYQ